MCRFVFRFADGLRPPGTGDLGILALPRLAEDGQQHDAAFGRQPVRDPYGFAAAPQIEPQLPHTVAQVS
ncbi:hypothetical protein GCM10009647_060800 [Streptomyces sanglieri]